MEPDRIARACYWLTKYTEGTADVRQLAGNDRKRTRRFILEVLTGQPATIDAARVTALADAFLSALAVGPGCRAQQAAELAEKAKAAARLN
jgi:hypothetical protein